MKPILAQIACIALLAGCGGGGGSVPPSPPAHGTQATKVAFSITIPAKSQTQSGARRPQYVSSGTQSISVTVTPSGGTALPTQTFNVTPTSNGCAAASGGGTTCTETVDAGVGSDTFAVACYSGTNAGGSVLASGSATQTIVINTTNNVAVTLGGVIASMAVVAPSTILENGPAPTSYTIPIGLIAKDAAGATIIGSDPYINGPVTLTMSDPGGTVTGGSATFTNPTSTTTVTYNGNPDRAGATFTLTGSGIPTATATTKSFAPPVPANLSLWLDGSDAGTLMVSGSSVSAWNDKSGVGNNVTQSTAADMPQLVAAASGINGRSVLSFNGTSQLLQTAGNFVSYVQPQVTIFLILKQGALAATYAFSMNGTDTNAQRFSMSAPWSDNTILWDYGDGFSDRIAVANQWSGGVHLAEMGGNETAGTSYLSFDGTQVGTNTSVTTPTAFSSALHVGAFNTVYFNGSLAEFLVYSRALPIPEAQNVEGYEAWKWGTQSFLPTTHPYSQFPYSCKGPLVNGQLTCS
jgi:hypothetical protein